MDRIYEAAEQQGVWPEATKQENWKSFGQKLAEDANLPELLKDDKESQVFFHAKGGFLKLWQKMFPQCTADLVRIKFGPKEEEFEGEELFVWLRKNANKWYSLSSPLTNGGQQEQFAPYTQHAHPLVQEPFQVVMPVLSFPGHPLFPVCWPVGTTIPYPTHDTQHFQEAMECACIPESTLEPKVETFLEQGATTPACWTQHQWETGQKRSDPDSDSDESKTGYLSGQSILRSSGWDAESFCRSTLGFPTGDSISHSQNSTSQPMPLSNERCLCRSVEKGKGAEISSVWLIAIDWNCKEALQNKLGEAHYHWWSPHGPPAKLSLQTEAKVSRLLSSLDKRDPEADGYHLKEGFKIHCLMDEPSLRRWPWFLEGPHRNRIYNINATLRVFTVDGKRAQEVKQMIDGKKSEREYFLRSAFESFCFFGPKTMKDHCVGSIDVQHYKAYRVCGNKKCLTDESFVDHLSRAYADPSFSMQAGIKLDATEDLVGFLEKHILDHSMVGEDVLMISEAALESPMSS
jgi:hypothetical protein